MKPRVLNCCFLLTKSAEINCEYLLFLKFPRGLYPRLPLKRREIRGLHGREGVRGIDGEEMDIREGRKE